MFQRLLERSYRRLGARYVPRAIFRQGVLVCPLVCGAIGVLSAYVSMSLAQYVRLSLVGCALQIAYTAISRRVVDDLARPIAPWLEGARAERETVAAWQAAACLPGEFARRTFSLSALGIWLAIAYVVWVAYFAWQVHLAFVTALLVYAGVAVLIAYTVSLRYFRAEQVVRPVLRDIAARLPKGTTPRVPGLSMRARMLAALPAINVLTALIADAVTRGGGGHLGDLALVVGIAVAVSATASLLLTVLLADSITEPIA